MKRPIRIAMFVAAALTAGVALAAEDHGAHGAAHHAPPISTLLLPVINFAIFAFLFARYAWPMIRGALAERRRVVEKELAEADRQKSEAQAMRAEIEAKRAGLQAEGERMIRQIREEAERERTKTIDEAKKTADRIRHDARLLAEQEAARAGHSIREEIAAKVIAEVTETLRRRVTDDDERRFVDEFVGTVEAR